MLQIRRAHERGHVDHGWLDSHHTFSFASYHDPKFMGFRSLRVLNEDRVAAGQGFGTHAHRDMEIVSYVFDGELEHRDSMGNGEVLKPGEFQRITAGTGITHSEFNPSTDQATHFYQIWLPPERKGLEPGYEQKPFDASARRNRLQRVASRDAAGGSLRIHADATIYLLDLESGHAVTHAIPKGRHFWIQILKGGVDVNGHSLQTNDAAALSDEPEVQLLARENSELMLFDLA